MGIATIEELVRASALLTTDQSRTSLISILVEQAQDISKSEVGTLYAYPADKQDTLKMVFKRGKYEVPKSLSINSDLIEFMEDCGEALIVHSREDQFFLKSFLNESMNSSIVLPLNTAKKKIGLLILNSKKKDFYGKNKLHFLDALTRLSGGMVHNVELFQEVKNKLKEIEDLQRYQESIFNSMTNLLITTDGKGSIHYFNSAAAERLGLNTGSIDTDLKSFFNKSLNKKILNEVISSADTHKEILGLEGIYAKENIEMDFSLNVSPLKSRLGKHEGLTLLFTDQSKEMELKQKANVAVEERRIVKDMFSRYMSADVLKNLMESPELVQLGGSKKDATVFFADIRGYTSFSEGKEPEYIIEILNEYFSEAVEIVIKYNGYIDKFIGDCIMAAWGVPVVNPDKDALAGVGCAVEIQELVKSKSRQFFKGKAAHLKVGIGMHSGPLISGNLGSSRRMDYSVIGDTVNIAARLEGVAQAGEVIITQQTRDLIGDRFKLKELPPVKVKGKDKPLHIFSVLKQVN
jgi:adenylate cyclase